MRRRMSALPFPEADLSAEDRTYVTGCLVQKNSHEGPERKGHMRMEMRITGLHILHPLAQSRLVGWLDVLSADLGTDPQRGARGRQSAQLYVLPQPQSHFSTKIVSK